MDLNEQTMKYIKNIIKFTKRYVQNTTEPKKIERDNAVKLSIGQHISIVYRENTKYFYFFYLGNQIFNLHINYIQFSGKDTLNYIQLQDKSEFFNHMVAGDLGKMTIQDFKDLEYIYKRLWELLH